MFKNYIISALRNSVRNPIFSLINILGLAIGLAVCILVYLFAVREMSFDTWIEDSSHLYRVEMHYNTPQWGEGYMPSIPVPLQVAIKDRIPEVKYSALLESRSLTLKQGDTVFYENIYEASPDILDIFPLKYINGSAIGALDDLNSIVLSERLAIKYFGAENPIGKNVTVDGNREMRVTAVYQDLPENSHLSMPAIVKFNLNSEPWHLNWGSNAPLIYVEVGELSSIPAIEAQFRALVDEHKPFMDSDTENPSEQIQFFLQPFKDIHLKSAGRTSANAGGNKTVLYGYIAIALLILTISCVNYINLSTARASKRVKEVCMRKVMGAGRGNLMSQFMGETFVFALAALLLSLVIVEVSLSFFTGIVGGELNLNFASDGYLWLLLLGLVAFIGLIAGIYPAFYISRFRPSKFLHANNSETGSSSRFRSVLVVGQFAIASALIAVAMIIYSQLSYVNSFDVGFENKNLVAIENAGGSVTKFSITTAEKEIGRIPGVVSVSRSYTLPTEKTSSYRPLVLENTNPGEAPSLRLMPGGYDFLKTLDIPLLAGRYLSEDIAGDIVETKPEEMAEGEVVRINGLLSMGSVKMLGLANADDAIGKTLRFLMDYQVPTEITIVGVVDDFIYDSGVGGTLENMIFYNYIPHQYQMIIRVEEGMMISAMTQLDEIWQSFFPDVPMRRHFVEDMFLDTASREASQGQVMLSSSFVAIFLSALGLLGLVIFMAEHRTKEIGLRKVMGARVRDVVKLLSWQFSKPIILANIIGLPLAWYFAGQWLEGFAQRIDLSVVYFIAAGLLTLLIGWLTVASHAFRVARRNPINALRVE